MIFLILIVILLFGGLVAYIAVQNLTQPVQLDLFIWHIGNLPPGVWLVAAFLSGAIVLYLVSMLSTFKDRHTMKVLRKQVLALEEQKKAMTQTSSTSTGQLPEGGLSAVNTASVMSVPGMMNTPQQDGRISSAPLSPLQNFRQ